MTRFAERFRVESSRLKNWDYRLPWWYFVTICTLNHNKFFGKIIGDQMRLSERGIYIDRNIKLIEKQFPFVSLDNYIIMPNHMHLLLKIKYSGWDSFSRDGINAVSNEKGNNLENINNQMTEKCLSRIIQWVKGKSTFEIRKELKTFFGWQSGYYDEVVKNSERLEIIKKYIENNPNNWQKDKLWVK
jgi:REP element-mobilizing transposase RayT